MAKTKNKILQSYAAKQNSLIKVTLISNEKDFVQKRNNTNTTDSIERWITFDTFESNSAHLIVTFKFWSDTKF